MPPLTQSSAARSSPRKRSSITSCKPPWRTIQARLRGHGCGAEARHYADLPAAPGARLGAALGATAGFLAAMVVLNLVMLIFLLIPPLFPFVFYGVNGYLLGREFFELVALRRIGLEEVRHLRKAHRGRLFLAGIVIAFLFTEPGLNLVAPVIATAAMVHLFEDFRRTQRRAI